MTGRTLAAVLLRVLGVMLLVGGLAAVGTLFLFFAPRDVSGAASIRATAMGGFFHVLVSVVAGIYLLRNGDRIGTWLVSDLDEPESVERPLTAPVIEGVGVRLLGIYLIVSGGRDVVGYVAELSVSPGEVHLNPYVIARAAGGLVELFAGILLLWKREQIAGALSRGWRTIRGQDED